MAHAQFEEPKDLDVPFSQRIGDGKNIYPLGKYDVSNPHPGYGKDPNILNEFGHTMYPKWVKSAEGNDVIVNNSDEEAEVTAALKQDGPTIEEYIAAGFKASTYPPKGYSSKSTKEEIDKAIEVEKAKGPATVGWGA